MNRTTNLLKQDTFEFKLLNINVHLNNVQRSFFEKIQIHMWLGDIRTVRFYPHGRGHSSAGVDCKMNNLVGFVLMLQVNILSAGEWSSLKHDALLEN